MLQINIARAGDVLAIPKATIQPVARTIGDRKREKPESSALQEQDAG
jgi:hypothetical protein